MIQYLPNVEFATIISHHDESSANSRHAKYFSNAMNTVVLERTPPKAHPTSSKTRAGIHSIAEKRKVTFEWIVRKDLGQGCRETASCIHRCSGAFQKAQPNRLLNHMGIKRHHKRPPVNEIRPKSDIHGRIVPNHPPQKHAHALAGGLCVFGNDRLRSCRRKIPADCINRRISVT